VKLRQRLDIYEKLSRLDKPIGILLLLWPTLWALWLAAAGVPPLLVLIIFVLGVVLMRSAGCIINDAADRKFDLHVSRTANRPLATKLISVREALLVAAVLAGLAFLLVLNLNALTVKLSFVALSLAVIYPFLKRFFWLPQAWLGITFGFGIPMAFAAIQGNVGAIAWTLLIANVFWVIAYDTEYAMVDRPDDLKLGLKSSAILFGRWDVAAVMACHAIFLLIMGGLGYYALRGMFYYVGLIAAALLLAYQYMLIRQRQPARCFKAFTSNNWVGAAVFAGIAADFFRPVRPLWLS
jgi:4-hydroxybenzoate polyprenyltransferase